MHRVYERRALPGYASEDIKACAERKFSIASMLQDIEILERVADIEYRAFIERKLSRYVADAHGLVRLGKQLQDSETLVYSGNSSESGVHR